MKDVETYTLKCSYFYEQFFDVEAQAEDQESARRGEAEDTSRLFPVSRCKFYLLVVQQTHHSLWHILSDFLHHSPPK